jgi:enoyl-CoA hydratase/carnithine racemase
MDGIEVTFEPPLARIRLLRPDKRNAISAAMWGALPEICAGINARGDALVVVVEGEGEHFCAGADIAEFERVYRDAAATKAYCDTIQDGLNALIALDRPSIAACRGNTIGGGLALALCCDLRFCADDAVLAITPARLGLLYGFAETRRLVEIVGPAAARDLLFSGRRVAPAEALAMRLIDRLVPAADLDAAIGAFAGELSRLSQRTIRSSKAAVAMITGGLAAEDAAFRGLVEDAALGPDFAEGRRAFVEKRAPRFTDGRG